MIVALPLFPSAVLPLVASTAVEFARAAEVVPAPTSEAAFEFANFIDALEPAPAPTSVSEFLVQGTRRAWEPRWIVQLGVSSAGGQYDTNQAQDLSSGEVFSVDFVLNNWRDEMGIGLEGGLWMNTYDAELDSTNSETVDTYRVLVGLRIADRGPDNPIWIPYARVGGMYRVDDGPTVSDNDLGWYAGGGIDFRLGSHVAITPQILYAESPSLNAQEWLLGVCLTLGF